MSNQTETNFSKWPFYAACFLGDVILLGCAYFIYTRHANSSSNVGEAALVVFCGTVGALLAVLPFVLEYLAAVKREETGALGTTIDQIKNLEEIAIRIGIATSQWQGVQEHSSRTTTTAKDIADRLTKEASAFTEFLQKAHDGERATLRLEVEKLRRTEGEWLQVLVRVLDHIHALNLAAARSGQPGLIEQLGNFQNACRDAARRIGLSPYIPAANEPFDGKCQTTPNADVVPAEGAKIGEVLATGYTFQGQLIRPALVTIKEPAAEIVATATPAPANTPAPTPTASRKPIAPETETEVEEQTLL